MKLSKEFKDLSSKDVLKDLSLKDVSKELSRDYSKDILNVDIQRDFKNEDGNIVNSSDSDTKRNTSNLLTTK